MKKLNYREIFIIVMTIIALLAISFLIINNKTVGSKKDFLYLETKKSNLKINNSQTVSDKIGIDKKSGSGYANFIIKADKLKSDEIEYEIYVKQINSVNSINKKYVKLYLTEKSMNRGLIDKPKTFDSLKVAKTDMNARQIYSGKIKKKEKINLELKMWLADTYTITNEKKNFEIIYGINVIK